MLITDTLTPTLAMVSFNSTDNVDRMTPNEANAAKAKRKNKSCKKVNNNNVNDKFS